MIIKQLKRQHQDIGIILRELAQKIKSQEEVKKNSMEISLKISELAGKLKIHLRTEDDSLYPSLLESKDQEVKEIANEFMKELGDLAKVFDQYRVKYVKKASIEQEPINFIKDTEQIIKAISKRVEREETQLYILIS